MNKISNKKFAIIFVCLCILALIITCVVLGFTNRKTTTTINYNNLEQYVLSEENENLGADFFSAYSATGNNSNSSSNIIASTKIIFDVVLVNFADCKAFDDESITIWQQNFADIKDYFITLSQGNVDVAFNLYLSNYDKNIGELYTQQCNYTFEQNLYDTLKANATPIVIENNNINGEMLILSTQLPFINLPETIFWPHAYTKHQQNTAIIFSNSLREAPVLCHEIIHTLGLGDLYSNNFYFNPGTNLDMMGANYSYSCPTNSYNRYLLGWAEESLYNDGITTDIEIINQSGSYIIDPWTSKNGTIAYKFGEKDNEFFLIETRFISSQLTGLCVARINTKYYNNLQATNQSNSHIYYFDSSLGSNLAREGESFGYNDDFSIGNIGKEKIIYSNGENSYVQITNIKHLENGKIQFDFQYLKPTKTSIKLNIFQSDNPLIKISGANIEVNNIKSATSNINGEATVNACINDVVTVSQDGYVSYTIPINQNIISSTTTINIPLIQTNQFQDKKQITLLAKYTIGNKQEFLEINEYDIYVNNVNQSKLIGKTNKIFVSEGDEIDVVSNGFFTLNLIYKNNQIQLKSNDEPGFVQYSYANEALVELTKSYKDYGINIIGFDYITNDLSNFTFTAYNLTTGLYEDVNIYAYTIKNSKKYYNFIDSNGKYSMLKIHYVFNNIPLTEIVYLDYNQTYYDVELTKAKELVDGKVFEVISDSFFQGIENVINTIFGWFK